MFDPAAPGPDYRLVWPVDLFRAEAGAVLALGDGAVDPRLALLFEEAFAGEQPRTDLKAAASLEWPDRRSLETSWSYIDPDERGQEFA
jgi:hypothetical protein